MYEEQDAEPRCFRCDKLLDSAVRGDSPWTNAANAVIMRGGDSFGSSLYDTMVDGISVMILVCDDCLKIAQNKVLKIQGEVLGN